MTTGGGSSVGKLKSIGGYELREKIHRSASGSVYRAFHPLLGREALVKTMPKQAVEHEEVLKRFQREIKLCAKLSHPHLLWAFHAGVEQGLHYLVLQNVTGIDLQTKVQREGPLPTATAVDLICQAGKGLSFLHENGIVHRNVKPANLMLDQLGVVRVTNLTAALIGAEADLPDDDDLTRQGQVLGTAEFLAPEQAFDSHSADARSDIYSLGCTLHFLLTGKVPYPGTGGHRTAANHIKQPIPSLRAARSDVPPEVDAVFQKMLAKMPADRYATLTDVTSDLQRALKGLAPQQSPTAFRLKPWILISVACLGAGLGAVLLLLLQRIVW